MGSLTVLYNHMHMLKRSNPAKRHALGKKGQDTVARPLVTDHLAFSISSNLSFTLMKDHKGQFTDNTPLLKVLVKVPHSFWDSMAWIDTLSRICFSITVLPLDFQHCTS